MQLIIFISNLLKLAQIINNTTLARLYLQCRMLVHHSSSRLAWWKHMTVQTNTRKEKNSIHIAPFPIRSACLRIIGMAMLPTADAPVKNLAASIQPPPSRLVKNWVEPPPKNKQGIGTSIYMRADNIGHQLLYSAQARICSRILDENIKARPARTSIVMAISKQLERGDRREEGERLATHQGKRSKGGRNQKEAKPFSPVTCSLVAYR